MPPIPLQSAWTIIKMQDVRQYFYGNVIVVTAPSKADVPASIVPILLVATPRHQFSPCLIEVSLLDVRLHCLARILLLASLLPISTKQLTDLIQLAIIP
jgi:hypothetical protein